MQPSPIGPLFGPQVDLEDPGTKSAAALGLVIIVGRVAPGLAGRAARLLSGTTMTAEGAVEIGPLFILNALPQPFGFVPAERFGLPPNYYLPPGSSQFVPPFAPGAKEQGVEDAQNNFLRSGVHNPPHGTTGGGIRPDLTPFSANGAVQQQNQNLANTRTNTGAAALSRAAQSIVQSALGAVTPAQQLTPTVPVGPTPPQQGSGGTGQAGGITTPQGPSAPGAPAGGPPNGFVTVPPSGNNAGGGTTSGGTGGWYGEFGGITSGTFIDQLMKRSHGDP
jgi:hypothetical protein